MRARDNITIALVVLIVGAWLYYMTAYEKASYLMYLAARCRTFAATFGVWAINAELAANRLVEDAKL